jgi:hypothetical protein
MARFDPRAEPESLPPVKAVPSAAPAPLAVPALAPPALAAPEIAPVAAPDPRLAKIEPLVASNDWKLVADVVGPIEDAAKLPANLGLLAAVAHNELATDGNSKARAVAIESMASLLGLPAESELVQVVTRRLLRKNPIGFRQRPAPPARTSFLIIVVVLILGSAAGWFLSSPMFWRIIRH